MDNLLGVYIHIPICDGKCFYCDFFSKRMSDEEIDLYTEILCEHISYWGKKSNGKIVDTVYLGGGTPGLLGTKRLLKIIEAVRNSFTLSDAEVTFEVNPSSGADIDFRALRIAGYNRVSIGLQSAVPEELILLGRRHSFQDAEHTVQRAREGGFQNISIDLMIGIPNQSSDSLNQSLNFVISQNVQHISCYILKLEKNTYMYRHRKNYSFPNDEECADLYEQVCNRLAEDGFLHYEISNFSKRGFESRHNLKYWKLSEYIGIGPSAHSFFEGKRFYYGHSLEDFYNRTIYDDGGGGGYEEFIMLSLRLKEGLNLNTLEKKYGFGVPKTVFERIYFLQKLGMLNFDGKVVSLSEKGFLVSNEIIIDILEALNKGMKQI